ncbi:MAG TPA: hypothetical protein PK331_02950 [Gordonia sp. (in: high G+C Gram-positive bacteria)]|uniref:hypothetical protein n=1 Tax=unclassified Gordonia (in: high G+C Gram-positive bacteria) TaxID=2657482 RepID=UPI000F95E764|nr:MULTISPECIES: hypothetical protein [unclassified Gordonia (in: high G+C Gram-positive bacteria)]RUP39095.1 MAG: hypothetical protein EKK60_07970 [Gordonia sp. (in: high G+C Gram-positive bacteria)]HNP58780.1 hypothetical protein [Gordonia sp. (in: high G+C Gram-positive bacteria)]HRC49869.1 hypothetical protein [Gordonia sp. (in: high G+C Gram-positive bacteria)]
MQIDTDSGATDWIDSRTTVRSRSGAITVTTTAHGLPVAVRITESAMAMGAEALAARVLELCREGAMTAGVRLRELMSADGVDDDVLATMALPTADDLARVQSVLDAQAAAPSSWLR